MKTKGQVEFEVAGGMCRLQFAPGMSTGMDPETNPGIGFALIGDSPGFKARDGKFYSGMGVFSRSDAQRLRDMLDDFLAAFTGGELVER